MRAYHVFVAAGLLFTTSAVLADKPVDTSNLPQAVRRTINESRGDGQLRKVITHRENGRVYYEVEYKERGDEKTIFVAEDGSVIRESANVRPGHQKNDKKDKKSKGKGKKGKGGQDEGEDEESDEPVSGNTNPSTTTPPPPQPSVVAHPPTPPPAVPPAVQPPTTPPAPGAAARTKADIKAELNRRINIINTLDDRPNAQRAALNAIARETGVAVKTLETQRSNHPVGTAGLLIANEIAKATGKPAANFLKQRLQKREWDVIAAENKVDTATLFPKLDRVEQSMANAISTTATTSPKAAATKR